MSHETSSLVTELKAWLTQQRFNPFVIYNYCRNAEYFLQHLSERGIALEMVTPDDVSKYLRLAVRRFRKRYGHPPAPHWEATPRAAIHALLRRSLKRWPPEPDPTDAGERLYREVLAHYEGGAGTDHATALGGGTVDGEPCRRMREARARAGQGA